MSHIRWLLLFVYCCIATVVVAAVDSFSCFAREYIGKPRKWQKEIKENENARTSFKAYCTRRCLSSASSSATSSCASALLSLRVLDLVRWILMKITFEWNWLIFSGLTQWTWIDENLILAPVHQWNRQLKTKQSVQITLNDMSELDVRQHDEEEKNNAGKIQCC